MGFQHAENVAPLPVRDFATQSIPFEFGKDGIFGTGKSGTDFGCEGKGLFLGVSKLRLKEAWVRDENVHFATHSRGERRRNWNGAG